MLANTILQLNIVDLAIAILLVKICYTAVKTGLVTEAFKLLGTIAATYLAMHYFTALADLVRGGGVAKTVGLEFLDFLAFIVLAFLGYGFFLVARMAFARFIKVEAAPRLNRIGGLALGVVRGLIAGSLLVLMLFISSVSAISDMARVSFFGTKIAKISFSLYNGMWRGFFSKVIPQERPNEIILGLQDSLTQK